MRVDTPTLTPLTVERHLALKHNYYNYIEELGVLGVCKKHAKKINRSPFLSHFHTGTLSDGHLFEVILPPFVTVGDVQGVQVFQGTSVVSEGHLGYPLQDLVKLLLAQGLAGEAKRSRAVRYAGSSGNIRVDSESTVYCTPTVKSDLDM